MSTPTFERLDNGLIKGFTYPRDELGRISWRQLLPSRYLYVNPDYEDYQTQLMVQQNVSKKWDLDLRKADDKKLLVTLAGLRYLAHLRGILEMKPFDLKVDSGDFGAVTANCTITFLPNPDDPKGLTTSGTGAASLHSVSGKFQLYLACYAENRSEVRAIKKALRIEILGADEVDFKASAAYEKALEGGAKPGKVDKGETGNEVKAGQSGGFDAANHLEERCMQLNKEGSHSFTKIKECAKVVKAEMQSDPDTWADFSSIPRLDALVLLGKINKAAESGKSSKKTK